ncbi:toprim domain-containing protein [Halanaerobium salsuginis]|uniref:DNA primase n=1 Tax=Halanaerobium salsuginis TaxID=29563 RepID=A0A1I4FZF5_9FIRM|nr:toprim domain-containing protein [Halanaerobium salsuginis]SFL22863.1 DNA primase [Halanaerobium salsuginis]
MGKVNEIKVEKILLDFTDLNIQKDRKFNCPSHDHKDENPSASINYGQNIVKCWSKCGGMGPVKLLSKIKGISEDQAKSILIKKYDVEVKPLTAEEEKRQFRVKLLNKYLGQCNKMLQPGQRKALKNRGLTDDMIDDFKIGYHEPNKIDLSEDEMIELGLARRTKNVKLYSNFADKVIIPLYEGDTPVYFMAWDYKDKSEIKYCFPKGWKKPLAGEVKNGVILVEGVFDYLILAQSGFDSSPILGSSLTKSQKNKLSKLDNFHLMLDSDQAGKKAADKIAEEFPAKTKIVELEDKPGADPNDLFLQMPEDEFKDTVKSKLENAQKLVDIRINKLKQQGKSLKSVGYFKNKIAPMLNKHGPAELEYYISVLSDIKSETGLSVGAIRSTLDSLKSDKNDDGKPGNLLEIYNAYRNNFRLFHDQLNGNYAQFEDDEKQQLFNIRSEKFKNLTFIKLRKLTSKLPSQDFVKRFIDNLSSEAERTGLEVSLKNRVALRDGNFFYDIANNEGEIIKVEDGKWEIINKASPIFLTEDHQLPQVTPDPAGEIAEMFELFSQFDKNQQILLSCYLPFALVPESPKPILYIQGEKGAGKTDFTRFLRSLIDPSILKSLKEPRKEKDTVQQMAHHYCCLYDNVNQVKNWFIRLACTAVTGEYDERRKLYTDQGSQFFSFKRVIIINAINRLGMDFSDFQDRMLLLKMERIKSNHRLTAAAVKEKMESLKPRIFGAMIKVLAEARAIVKDIEIDELPRMADFMFFGAAVAEVLGFGKEAFINAYKKNMADINREMLENQSLALTVLEYLEKNEQFKGQASELLQELEDVAIDLHINTRKNDWPGSPSVLSRRLNEIKSNLYEQNIIFKKGKESGKNASRYIVLKKEEEKTENQDLKLVKTGGEI